MLWCLKQNLDVGPEVLEFFREKNGRIKKDEAKL